MFIVFFFFFFTQKTAYDLRISDWSSDVCSSDLLLATKVNRYDDPTVQGNDLPRSPAFTLNTGFVGTPVVGLDISFDIRFTDSYYSDVFKDARAKTDPYVLANAQISYRTGAARIFAAVTNLFNTTDVQSLVPGATRAEDIATISRPRRFTAGLEEIGRAHGLNSSH